MNELTVFLDVPEEVAKTIISSIRPEIDSDAHARSTVEMKYDKGLVLYITAGDLHALRAAANTYVRWLDMCVKLAK